MLISRSSLVQCKSQFHGIIRWFALLPNWWNFLVREEWAGLLGFWSGDSHFTCTIWAHTECDLCSQMADSPAPKAAFLNGMQAIPLHGALPGLGGFKVTFSFAEGKETFSFIVCLLIYPFIYFLKLQNNFNDTVRTSAHEVPAHCGYYLHNSSCNIFNNNGTIVFLKVFFVYNLGLLLLDSTVYCSVWNWIRQRKTWAEEKLGRKQPRQCPHLMGVKTEDWGMEIKEWRDLTFSTCTNYENCLITIS